MPAASAGWLSDRMAMNVWNKDENSPIAIGCGAFDFLSPSGAGAAVGKANWLNSINLPSLMDARTCGETCIPRGDDNSGAIGVSEPGVTIGLDADSPNRLLMAELATAADVGVASVPPELLAAPPGARVSAGVEEGGRPRRVDSFSKTRSQMMSARSSKPAEGGC
jgi:hypothetical protein